MKHKVTCMDCGKTERIEVGTGKKIEWGYYGKMNINACQTDKFHFRVIDTSKGLLDKKNLQKVPNPCYDSSVKPKWVELWACPDCEQKEYKIRPVKKISVSPKETG